VINTLILVFIILIATYTDIKTKEVPNKLIVIGLGIAFLLNINNLIPFTINLIIGITIFYSLWKIGGFGAGDSKIFILVTIFQQNIINTMFLFVLTGIIFISYNMITKTNEKRLLPFILIGLIIQITLYILL